MHPWILQELATVRQEEIARRLRHREPTERSHHPRRVPQLRERLGWRIVELGLRLARVSFDRPSVTPEGPCGPADCGLPA